MAIAPWSPLYFWVFFFFILLRHCSLRSVLCWAGPNKVCGWKAGKDVPLLWVALLQDTNDTMAGSTRPPPAWTKAGPRGDHLLLLPHRGTCGFDWSSTRSRILLEISHQWSHSSIQKQLEKGWRERQEVKVLGLVIFLRAEAGMKSQGKDKSTSQIPEKSASQCLTAAAFKLEVAKTGWLMSSWKVLGNSLEDPQLQFVFLKLFCQRSNVVKVSCGGGLVAKSSLTLRPRGLWPTRLLCPWDSPGKNTGVGCHVLLQGDQTQVSCIAGRFFTIWAT